QETRVCADIHVQPITGAGPLVAVGGLPDRPRSTRDAGPAEHLPDGRVRKARRPGHKPRPPASLSPAVADPLLQIGGEKPRRAVRPTRAVQQRLKLPAAIKPAMPPSVHRRRRHAEAGCSLLQRTTILDRAHEREPPGQSELGVSVQIHPSPPSSVSPGRPTASKEGRITPQPFTTSVGGTPSHGPRLAARGRAPRRRR